MSGRRQPCRVLLNLAALALLPVSVLRAQELGLAAADPFAELHASLNRAVDFELEQAAETARRTAKRVTVMQGHPATAEMPSGNALPVTPSLEKLTAVRQRLQALGVDAGRIFTEEGVPLELLVLAGVESKFDPLALSPKGARGLWQLMPETAVRFGLRVGRQADDRTHAARSTRAAARYLRELHAQFGDWLLVLAAYNAGEMRIRTAIERTGARDFWQLAARDALPEETRRYVPALLAAMQKP